MPAAFATPKLPWWQHSLTRRAAGCNKSDCTYRNVTGRENFIRRASYPICVRDRRTEWSLFFCPSLYSIEINGHFRQLLSGGWCLKMYFLFSIPGIEAFHVRVQRNLLVSLPSLYIKTRWKNLQTTVWFAVVNDHVTTEYGYVCFALSTA